MIKVYFGKNGIGKTEELRKNYKENKDIKFKLDTEKNFSPDEHVKTAANNVWSSLEKFLNNLLIEKIETKLDPDLEKLLLNSNIKFNENKLKAFNITQGNIEQKILNNTNEYNKKENVINKVTAFKLNRSLTTKNFGYGNVNFQVIYILSEIIKRVQKGSDIPVTIYLDEPEKNMHPQLIKETAIMLKEISKDFNLEITTHSPLLINYLWEKDKVELYTKKNHTESKFNLVDIAGDNFKENIVSYREDLFKSLFHEKVIIVEDNNTFKFIENYLFENNIYNIVVIIAGKKSKIPLVYNDLTKVMKISCDNIHIFYDIDDDKTEQQALEHKKWNKNIADLECEKTVFIPEFEKQFSITNKTIFGLNEYKKIIDHKDFKNVFQKFTSFIT